MQTSSGGGVGSLEEREVFDRHKLLDVHQRWASMIEAKGTFCLGLWKLTFEKVQLLFTIWMLCLEFHRGGAQFKTVILRVRATMWVLLYFWPIDFNKCCPMWLNLGDRQRSEWGMGILKNKSSPGWHGSVDWAPAWEPKGHRFNSQSGHMPGLQGQVPSRGRPRGNHTLMFLSLSFSLPSALFKNK